MKITKITRSESGRKSERFYIDFVDNGGQRHKLAGYQLEQKTKTLADKVADLLALHYQDKQATPDLMNWFNDEPERIRKTLTSWGLLPDLKAPEPPKTIQQHIADFQTSLETRRKSESHYIGTTNKIKTVAAFCGWKTTDDISAFGIEEFIKSREAVCSGTTLNNYITACMIFTSWLRKHRRIDDNPLKDVLEKINAETEPRGVLNPEQFQTLIEKTFSNNRTHYTIRKKQLHFPLDGRARAILYLVAGLTGYRRGELLALRWGDVRLSDANPVILLDAGRTKNGKAAIQPLPPALVKMLTVWQAIQNPTAETPLFPDFTRHSRPSEWIREDLTAAELPTKDAEGNKIDFHSLRASYISFLANSNTPVKVTQTLARHSTPTLTMNTYARTFSEPKKAAVNCLPGRDFSADIIAAVCQRKTATASVDKTGLETCTFQDFSGQLEGQDIEPQRSGKTALLNQKQRKNLLGRGGVEPPTHEFSVRCNEDINTENKSTYDFDTTPANASVTVLQSENPELFEIIRHWPGLLDTAKKEILRLAGLEGLPLKE